MLTDCGPYQSIYEVIVGFFTLYMMHVVEAVILSKIIA
jgi:hypothetical protein